MTVANSRAWRTPMTRFARIVARRVTIALTPLLMFPPQPLLQCLLCHLCLLRLCAMQRRKRLEMANVMETTSTMLPNVNGMVVTVANSRAWRTPMTRFARIVARRVTNAWTLPMQDKLQLCSSRWLVHVILVVRLLQLYLSIVLHSIIWRFVS